MKARAVAPALLAIASVVGAACGDDPAEVESGAPTSTQVAGFGDAVECSDAGGLCVTLTVTPDPPVSGAAVTWHLVVENRGETPITLTFSSGQQAEVALTEGDREVWRWSEGRAFTQVVSEFALGPGEQHEIELEGRLDVPPGTYEVTAELRAPDSTAPISKQVRVVGVP